MIRSTLLPFACLALAAAAPGAIADPAAQQAAPAAQPAVPAPSEPTPAAPEPPSAPDPTDTPPPQATTPQATTPQATPPQATPPQATTPQATTPKAATPPTSTPEPNTPPPPRPAETPAARPQATEPAAPPPNATPSPTLAIVNDAKVGDIGVKGGISPAILRAEVMLDRVHASPGVIDGRAGANFEHALEIYEKVKRLKVTKGLDPEVWNALLKESGGPVLMEYTLTDKDVEGPFMPDIPKDYKEQAKLKTLAYHDPAQKIGAKFHMGEELLAALNPGIDLGKAGGRIVVADIKAEPIHGKVERIVVDKKTSEVLGYGRRGHLLLAFPATIGSKELPSPSGTYKVKGVAYNPVYYYNPKNFVQDHNEEKLKLPPGPNNPVGSVFIALTKPTYGLHGSPDPSKIDKESSHGCVRMTNWDADILAHLVRPGVVVHFEK